MVLVLLGLLFQVQTVFACQMMDMNEPMEQCCCDDSEPMASTTDSKIFDSSTMDCCDIDFNIKVANINANNDEGNKTDDFALRLRPDIKPFIDVLIVVVATIYTELAIAPDAFIAYETGFAPANSGTTTYLASQRLRI